MKLPAVLRALRPHQWSKNIFVLAPLAFAWGDRSTGAPLVDASSLFHTLMAFGAFCLGASAIYLVNDLLDAEQDRQHPEKCRRPIASGELAVPTAVVLALGCALGAVGLAILASPGAPDVALVLLSYMGVNLAYSLGLKRIVLVDVFCIASGFLFRVLAGGYAAGAPVSHWLLLCTLFLALFLALNKRRAEIVLLGEERHHHRKTLREYDVEFLDQMVTMLAAVTIVCYTMYAVDDDTVAKFGNQRMFWTVPFVVFGVARYMFLVQTDRAGGSPTKVLLGGDGFFLVNSLLWLATAAWAVLG